MVQFYDPDASSASPSTAMQVEVEPPPEPRAATPRPIWEWVVLGLALAVGLYTAWSELRRFGSGTGGLFLLIQFAFPMVIALVAAAVTSLLLRRVLRAHGMAMSAELEQLRLELRERTREPGEAAG